MDADIGLDSNIVTVECDVLTVHTTDIRLDTASRCIAGSRPDSARRALVHDFKDGLTVNYGRDYPGGVTGEGPVHVDGGLNATGSVSVQSFMVLVPSSPFQRSSGQASEEAELRLHRPGRALGAIAR